MKSILTITLLVLLAGCTSPRNLLDDEARLVEIHKSNQNMIDQCEYLGEVIGSEGHWYSFFLFGNDALMQGAINSLKNKAHILGANTILLSEPQTFATSVTLLGTAYQCE
ncbi:DUF4156 domain-containing protein [Vibrio tapetis subsp. quintayensis]|uniref:DUF4156 domain-containing protein n=1 Tax=Vibrio tapetis TaxID=52443 RepID=UPI0025B4285F|nr:DUF4156 domain-containing protein [Vibrio tapetis]MDN3682665.1 DUF4156 domain-containing protein [Vibrio tapetis subsp. quintayensis]